MQFIAASQGGRCRVAERRMAERRPIGVPGRLVWRDARGATRFATVRTRDVSGAWLAVDCLSGTPIPLYRLVHLQLDPSVRAHDLPDVLRSGKLRGAVYRLGAVKPTTGAPDGYLLRLLVGPSTGQVRPVGQPDEVTACRRLPAFIAARSIA